MQESINLIQTHANKLKKLEENKTYLFEQLNNLDAEIVTKLIDIFKIEYFQPVNLLRFEILQHIKDKKTVTSELIEEIKDRIVKKDNVYFSKYGEALVSGLMNYPVKKKTPFVNWNKYFSIFFPFFYLPEDKKESDNALNKISNELINTLELKQYKAHIVGFEGPNNYGDSSCWIALFPKKIVSHKKAYQLFLRILDRKIEAGIMPGWDINDKDSNTVGDVNTIEEVVEKLRKSRDIALSKNNSLIDEENSNNEKEKDLLGIKQYSFFLDVDKPFIEESELKDILDSLEFKKNIVLQGPPGVGKTFVAKKIAHEMMKKTDDTKIEIVQFHQSYSYEDFIQGIRPSEKTFKVKNGVFHNFCKKAEQDSKNKYFFIIDEINRGNLSKIFGELMMLIETDKRGKSKVHLTYSEKDDAPFSVPENLYIIGTMNTADRSLAIVDYALRRRFRFISLKPKFNDKFVDLLSSQGFSKDFIHNVIAKIDSLNQKIQSDKNLGEGFQIGHSFFCTNKMNKPENEWFKDIIKYEIAPLLEEYWFDDLEKSQAEIKLLLSE